LEKATIGRSKIQNLLNTSKTEHSLRVHHLQFLDEFVPKPTLLISRLITKSPELVEFSIDVMHSVAKEIASRYSIDMDKLKLLLLQQWLTDEKKMVRNYFMRLMKLN
jgi:2-polyprenyl-3-methyl-5-hydroxy-6-metoxy-1,4-benzoquinol methylase